MSFSFERDFTSILLSYFLIHSIFHFYSYTASSKSNGSQSHANLQPQASYSTNATCTCEKFWPHQQL